MAVDQPLPAQIPLHIQEEIDRFEEQSNLYLQQVVGEKEFTPICRDHGIYGQRQPGNQMVRVKIPSGMLSAEQMDTLADIAERYAPRKLGHITTRQNIQYHFVPLTQVPEIMRQLASVGLTTREACGNTVRNIKCCSFAGLHPQAPFDPTPYALATTAKFLRNDEVIAERDGDGKTFFNLPRKFKITFGGCCGGDCGQAAINDIGFLATVRRIDGRVVHGFEMRVGGGLAAQPREATTLVDFVPGDQVLVWTEAVLRVFATYGNYDMSPKGRAHARLKYLINDRGWEWFKEEVYRVRQTLALSEPVELPAEETESRSARAVKDGPGAAWADTPEYAKWRRINTRPQRQAGFLGCYANVLLGDMTAEQMHALARLAVRYGDGTIRLTDAQNVLFRWVREENVPHLFAELQNIGLGEPRAGLIGDVTSCPGADTCKYGITSSKGLARELTQFLDGEGDELAKDPDLGQIHIKISGCPHSCGQHHIAAIGLHGGSQTLMVNGEKRSVPAAMLLLGGGLSRDGVTFGRRMLVLPAKKVRQALPLLAELYKETRTEGESFEQWARRIDKALVVQKLESLTKKNPDDPEIFVDAGQETPYVFSAVEDGK